MNSFIGDYHPASVKYQRLPASVEYLRLPASVETDASYHPNLLKQVAIVDEPA
jgi:hypothetical protein